MSAFTRKSNFISFYKLYSTLTYNTGIDAEPSVGSPTHDWQVLF